jgi:hypothetical protein
MKKGANSKVTVAKKRWFILFGSAPLNGEQDDGDRIQSSDLAGIFKLDHIYYFKYDSKGDTSSFIGLY